MPAITFTYDQTQRLIEYIEEVKDCHELCGEITDKQWCDYFDAWVDPENNFAGYVKEGGVRPRRPHALE